MKISYLQNNKNEMSDWNGITREERFFCSELFHHLRSDQSGFLSLIKNGINKDKVDEENLKFLKNIETKEFDIGFEVCFYRDLLKWHGHSIKKVKLPQKRTFDLALFSEEAIVIIEAKAQQGFDTEQLIEFEKDNKRIERIFDIIGQEKKPEVYIVGLHSSNYNPRTKTKKYFDSLINWKDIAEKYPDSHELFIHANTIYRNYFSLKSLIV